MEFSVPQFVTYIIAWLGLSGGIWALFERAETVLKKEIREDISNWLNNISHKSAPDLPSTFISVFDRVFGEKHFSWKCFFRSCIASVIAILIMLLIITAFSKAAPYKGIIGKTLLESSLIFLFSMSVLNLIPDYFSLLESRIILGMMVKKHILTNVILLILDILLTLIIFLIFLIVVLIISSGFPPIISNSYSSPIDVIHYILSELIMFWRTENFYSVFLYSSFFTSVWVWLYFLSSIVVKLMNVLGFSIGKMGGVFDINEKPLRSIGFVSIILVTLIFILLPFFT